MSDYDAVMRTTISLDRRIGMQVDGTKYYRNGRRFRGAIINHFTLLLRQLVNVGPSVDYQADIRQLKRTFGIPAIRFAAGFYSTATWYNNWYLNKTAFYAAMDAIVAEAEREGMGLYPTLFWGLRPFVDSCYNITGTLQVPSSLDNPNSIASLQCESFIDEFVSRYWRSPAIWGWIVNNEAFSNCGPEYFSTWALDGTGVDGGGTPLPASLAWGLRADGTPYVPSDKMSAKTYFMWMQRMIQKIRSIDTTGRMITCGEGLGNSFGINAQTTNTLSADTLVQWNSVTSFAGMSKIAYINYNASAVDTHLYPRRLTDNQFFLGDEKTQPELVALYRGWADAINKPLFLSEMGATWYGDPVDETSVSPATEAANWYSALATAKQLTDLFGAWAYGGSLTGSNAWEKWCMSAGPRIYQLESLAAANREMAASVM